MRRRILETVNRTLSNFIHRIDEGSSPRWIVFLIDLTIIEFNIIFAFLLRFNFELGSIEKLWLFYAMGFVLLVRGSLSLAFRTFAHVIRYTATMDIMRLVTAVGLGSFILLSLSIAIRNFFPFTVFPLSVIIIESFLTISLLTSVRFALKYIYRQTILPYRHSKHILIVGSKEKAVLTREALEIDRSTRNKVVAFLDTGKISRKRLAGLPIYGLQAVEELIVKHNIELIVLAKEELSEKIKEKIASICNTYNLKLLYAPENWMTNVSNSIEMKEVNIEELLTRDPINLDKKHLHKYLKKRSILVTGAAGSIGSELVRQLTRYNPKHLILLDQAETPLYNLELDLGEKLKYHRHSVVLANILHAERIEKVFDVFRPEIVFHAAAYKHVPMLENNPIEAYRNNVEGTKIVADLANRYDSEKFLMISTDKAVNPTGVMGASKRIAEMYVQTLNDHSETAYITTRFGNVLNSSGSAIPRFLNQIKEGGPVTVTHPEITRYFMTIQEACQLVLEASLMGSGGELYLFDMGTPIKIADLVKRLIKLTGHAENEIEIKYTGLREGEKLFEELLLESEPSKPTHHPKIMISEVMSEPLRDILLHISKISAKANQQDVLSVVRHMKRMVPTFKSSNSVYVRLDT